MEREGKKKFSIFAILGIIAGVLSPVSWISVIGIILNTAAFVQISKSKQRGKVLAIIGLVLSAIFLFLKITRIFSFDF